MASIYEDIRKALEVRLSAVSGVPAIAWENITFEPTTGQPYIKPRLIPTQRVPAVRGLNPQMYYQGLLRVECFSPEGLGPRGADDLADLIMDNFEATTDISEGSVIVSVDYAEREQGSSDGTHFMVPVNIGWYIYA